VASFTDLSYQVTHGAGLVSQLWNFGDTASGAADESTLANPEHQYSGPGSYAVTLTETDVNGLASTDTQIVTVPGPPSAAFQYAQGGEGVTFGSESKPAIADAPTVARHW
jgi:PKD repeat protein